MAKNADKEVGGRWAMKGKRLDKRRSGDIVVNRAPGAVSSTPEAVLATVRPKKIRRIAPADTPKWALDQIDAAIEENRDLPTKIKTVKLG